MVHILFRTDQEGNDAAYVTGVLDCRGEPRFTSGDEVFDFEIPDDWFPRIQKVIPEMEEIASGAQFFIALSVGSLPTGRPLGEYKKTGLRWPKKEDEN